MNDNGEFAIFIYNITHLIRGKKDFETAAMLIKEKNYSFEYLCSRTYKLTQREIAILADKMLGL